MGLRTNSLRAATSAIASSGLRFALFAALARLSPKDSVGEFAAAQWIAEMSALACSLGVTSVATRYLPQLQTIPGQYRIFNRFWLRWAIGVIALASFAGFGASLWSLSGAHWLTHLMVGAWSAGSMAYALHLSLLTGMQRFDLVLRSNLVFGLAALVLAVLSQVASGSQPTLYGAMVLSYAFAILSTATPLRALASEASKSTSSDKLDIDLSAVRSYALNSCITGLLWALAWSRGELPFLVHFHSAEEVALFTAATVLTGGATQFTMLGVSALGPHLTQLWFAHDRPKALALAKTAMSLQLLLSGAVAVALALFSREILVAAFGQSYENAAGPLAILAMTIPALSVAAQSHLIQISTDGRVNRNIIIVIVLVLYTAAFFLVPWLASIGAAYARLIAVTLSFVAMTFLSAKAFGRECISLRAVALTVTACTVASICSQMSLSIAQRLLVLIAIFTTLLILIKDSEGRPVIRRIVR